MWPKVKKPFREMTYPEYVRWVEQSEGGGPFGDWVALYLDYEMFRMMDSAAVIPEPLVKVTKSRFDILTGTDAYTIG